MLKIFSTIVEYNDARLVVVAGLVCALASYTALSLAVKPAPAEKIRYPWLIASGVAVGSGGWAAYLILLLGFQPGASFAFELTPTVFALAVGIAGSCIGLFLARGTDLMPLGGAIVGFAIAASFYVGMMGIQFSASKSWNSLYVITSILVGASCGAAALARGNLSQDILGRVISSATLSFGIMATCLIGLSGLDLTPNPEIVAPDNSVPVLLGISLTAVVMLIASLGVVGALVDQYIAEIESARSAADAANESKMRFLANMSHELRTPLNAVIGFSEMMTKEVFGAIGHQNYKEYAKDIRDSGTHLLQIINDILDITKADVGTLKLNETAVDCRELILSSCQLLRPGVQKEQLTLSLDVPVALPRLNADARMVKQVLLNLLTNAVKFTPAGGRIEVWCTANTQYGLTITVRDTGIGISEADIQRVREPFIQADSSLSRRHEGAGLGLPLVEMMMKQHGGALELTSKQGKGTTAQVIFPPDRLIWSSAQTDKTVVEGKVEPNNIALGNEPAPVEFKLPNTLGTARVLVVEDERNLCDLLCRILERAGYATAGATNGQEALRQLRAEPFDLVITDMVMPEMDGVELMRVLHEEKPALPIIMISGVQDMTEYQRIAKHLGAKLTLRKPIAQADLIGAVSAALAPEFLSKTNNKATARTA